LAGFAIVASLVLVGLWATLTNGTANLGAGEHRTASRPVKSCKSHAQPPQGIYQDFSDRPVAPLSIRTAYGTNFFIKLEDAATGDLIQSLFVYGGSTFETRMPLGDVILKYATGEYWCGKNALFGPETQFYKTDKVFSFNRTYDGVEGYTVELISQHNGNLTKTIIDRSSF
jgi:hypothetical protein